MPKRKQYRFPNWLYNALPYFYLISGLLTAALLGNAMAAFSGLTLMSAGAVVWVMRRRYRSALAKNRHRQAFVEDRGGALTRLVQISWRDSFDCGHEVIDAQHRRLFGVSNELINAVLSGKPKFDLECLLQELIDDITVHFSTEEALLATTANPMSQAHKQHHLDLLAKAKSLQGIYHDDEMVARELVSFIAYDVITEHVLKEDIKWAAAALPVNADVVKLAA